VEIGLKIGKLMERRYSNNYN